LYSTSQDRVPEWVPSPEGARSLRRPRQTLGVDGGDCQLGEGIDLRSWDLLLWGPQSMAM
jgi:hypothetical protein